MLNLNDTQLNYFELNHPHQEGQAKSHETPVVLIHGFCESSTLWKFFSQSLSKDFRILYPDLPGFGKSPLPNDNFSLEQIGDQIVSWLKSLDINQCIIFGHSLGGYISLEILRKYPYFVDAIGLINSSAFEDSSEKKGIRNKLIEFVGTQGVLPFINTFIPSLFYPKTINLHSETIELISEEGKSIKSASVIKYAAAMRDRRDSLDLLKEYHDRILLISGEYDQNIPLDKSKEMANILDKENVHIMPNSAHMSIFEQRELCRKAIIKFTNSFNSINNASY